MPINAMSTVPTSDHKAQVKLISIFFGGGTPSLWDAPSLARVTQGVLDSFSHHADDLEITVECNPGVHRFDVQPAAGGEPYTLSRSVTFVHAGETENIFLNAP